MDIKRICKIIDKHEVVSFDMFDTLIKRNVYDAKDIFDLVETEYNKIFCKDLSGFRKERVKAESIARQKSKFDEISIEEIYQEIDLPEDTKSKLIELEILVEINLCQTNYTIKDIYEYCVKTKKRIIVITDMYLNKNTIKKILTDNGFIAIEKIYVSSEKHLTKRNGGLFQYVLKDLNISRKQMIHIGDAIRADNIIPRRMGIATIHICRKQINASCIKEKDFDCYKGVILPFINNNLPKYKAHDKFFQLGYELLGPLIFGFCLWIKNKKEELGIEHMYFLARDMYLFYQSYNILYNDNNVDYLEVSRKSLRRSYVEKYGFVRAKDTMSRDQYCVKDYFKALEIDFDDNHPEDSLKEIRDYLNKSVDSINDNEVQVIDDYLSCVFKNDPDYCVEYLIQKGLLRQKMIAIIDIGWHGTIQNMLEKICDRDYFGLYFGNTKRNEYSRMHSLGYWFDSDDERTVLDKLSITYILEVMLFPKTGTTLSYHNCSGVYKPKYGKTPSNNSFIQAFQEGAMQFVVDISSLTSYIHEIPSQIATLCYSRLAYYPTLTQAKKFSALQIEDGEFYELVTMHKPSYYLLHPNVILKDYKRSKWKEGFIKRIVPVGINPHSVACLIKKRRM